jgi:hypothetical protein
MAQDLHYKKGEHGLVRQSPYVMLPVPDVRPPPFVHPHARSCSGQQQMDNRGGEQALDIVLREAAAARRQAERVELRHASGLVLAADARATMALPPFPASIMDGYAVVASVRTASSSPSQSSACPMMLTCVRDGAAGHAWHVPRGGRGQGGARR